MIIDVSLLEKIKSKDLFLEEYFILYCKYANNGWLVKYRANDLSYNKLCSKGYLTKARLISKEGTEVLADILFEENNQVQLSIDEGFNEFWKMYPKDDGFRHWATTRPLKWNERKAKGIYISILREGKYSADYINRALEKEIALRTKNSIKENQFKWMKGAINWLSERMFENILDDKIITEEDDYERNVV